jgi:hypothetical protein
MPELPMKVIPKPDPSPAEFQRLLAEYGRPAQFEVASPELERVQSEALDRFPSTVTQMAVASTKEQPVTKPQDPRKVVLIVRPGEDVVVTLGGNLVKDVAEVTWTPAGCRVVTEAGTDLLSGEKVALTVEEQAHAAAKAHNDIVECFGHDKQEDGKDDHGKAPGKLQEPLSDVQRGIASFFSKESV